MQRVLLPSEYKSIDSLFRCKFQNISFELTGRNLRQKNFQNPSVSFGLAVPVSKP